MEKVTEYMRWIWDQVRDQPGAFVTGAVVAIVVIVALKVISFLVGIGG